MKGIEFHKTYVTILFFIGDKERVKYCSIQYRIDDITKCACKPVAIALVLFGKLRPLWIIKNANAYYGKIIKFISRIGCDVGDFMIGSK